MNKENNTNNLKGIKEFEMAWQEYFKDKPNPKNDEEEREEQEEFYHWYNYVRKQSDTEKTPAEMYKEIYGKEPPKNPTEISRIMNFEWDEDYDEDETSEEELEEMKDYFDKEIWPRMKRELKERTKKDACFVCFVAGSEMMNYSMNEEMKDAKEKLNKMSSKEIENMIKQDIKKDDSD